MTNDNHQPPQTADPVVAAALRQAQQAHETRQLSPAQRREKEKMQSRLPGRLTIDIGAHLKTTLESIAHAQELPVSQLTRFLILYALDRIGSNDIEAHIHDHRIPSRSPRYTWILDLDEIEENIFKGIP